MADDLLLDAADRFLATLLEALVDTPSGAGELEPWSARLLAEVRGFERLALHASGDGTLVTDASYLLCTLGDELLTERFGMGWTAVGLLVRHHGDVHGGQRCWARLDALLHGGGDPVTPITVADRRALLRLYERAISLGMRGRHGVEAGGEQTLDRLRRQLRDSLHPGSGDGPMMTDLVALATRHVQQRRRGIGATLAGLSLAVLLILFIEVRRDIDARWDEAATEMVGAATRGVER